MWWFLLGGDVVLVCFFFSMVMGCIVVVTQWLDSCSVTDCGSMVVWL